MLRGVQLRLPQLARLFGRYGWPDLQVIVTNAAAMEHTALVMTPAFDIVLTHELAHEWWYALLGNDQAAAPWLDEGFATWSESAVMGTQLRCPDRPRLAPMSTRGVDFFRTRPFSYGAVYDGGACLLAAARAPHRPRALPSRPAPLRARAPLRLALGRGVPGRHGGGGEPPAARRPVAQLAPRLTRLG